MVHLSSAEDTASTDSSLGSNCKEVIACVCHLMRVIDSNGESAPYLPAAAFKCLKSQILNSPLSSPEASKNLAVVFQEMTFTSQS